MNSVEILGFFRVNVTWFFIAPNFPVCVYEEVEV
jgi:hypothetical protein